jgi:hypothetical protein
MGILLSIAIAIFLFFNPIAPAAFASSNFLGLIFIGAPLLLFFLFGIIFVYSLAPLQKTEQNFTPHLFGLLKKDKLILGIYCWVVIFVMISVLMAIDAQFLNHFEKNHLLAAWVVGLGFTVDAIYSLLKRMMAYLNPFDNVLLFTKMAQESIQNDKELDLCEAIDSLSEIALKSLHKMGPSLCNQSLQELQVIVKNFLASSKSIGHAEADIQSRALGIKDRISYTLFYIFDRIALINDEALAKRLEQVISTIVAVLGKIIIHCAKFDLTLVGYPVHFLTRNAKAAIDKGMDEIGIKATLTLLEVSRTIIDEVDYTYADLKDPFFSIIGGLEEITKDTFLHDKTINLKILTQPFRDLKEIFKNPKVVNHQDTPAIIQDIDRVLGEYDSLELVMKTIPPIPQVPENPPQ